MNIDDNLGRYMDGGISGDIACLESKSGVSSSWVQFLLHPPIFARSSNGRTPGFGPGNWGSSP